MKTNSKHILIAIKLHYKSIAEPISDQIKNNINNEIVSRSNRTVTPEDRPNKWPTIKRNLLNLLNDN